MPSFAWRLLGHLRGAEAWQCKGRQRYSRAVRSTTRPVLAGAVVCMTFFAAAVASHAQELTLRYAGGSGACIAALTTPGCAPLRGVMPARSDESALRAIAMSPDGRHVYLTFQGQWWPRGRRAGRPTRHSALVVLRRRADTGALSQLPGRRGCLTLLVRRGCSRARAIDDPWGIVVSPDGRFVYSTATGRAAAAVFARDRTSGALRQLPGRQGCIRLRPTRGGTCARLELGGAPGAAHLSPDGRFLYAFERPLRRDTRTGTLAPAAKRPCPR